MKLLTQTDTMAYIKGTPLHSPYKGSVEEKPAAPKPKKEECHLEGRVAELEERLDLLLKVLKRSPELRVEKLSEGKL